MQKEDIRIDAVVNEFKDRFGCEPACVVQAPGRVEVMGGHTDYNDGFVMPTAINRNILIAASATQEDTATAYSRNFDETSTFSVIKPERSQDAPWSNYIRGVVDQLAKAGIQTPGMQMVVDGSVPLGSGLSSSAALEVATAFAVYEVTGQSLPGKETALLCQRAENQFVGVNSGIMDQFISVLGQEGKAMFLDCRSLDYQHVNYPAGTRIVVCDSKKPRTLAGSEYNIRRAQCEEAVRILKQHIPGIKALRDVSAEDLAAHESKLPEVVRKRARHIVRENDRVLQAVRALNHGDSAAFGDLLNESHASSRDLYEISCDELNWLQEAAVSVDGCLGSRLSGAGFGGCTVSIVREGALEQFERVVTERFRAKAGIEPGVDVMSAAGGAGRVR